MKKNDPCYPSHRSYLINTAGGTGFFLIPSFYRTYETPGRRDPEVYPRTRTQWSQCPAVSFYLINMGLLGLHPLKPGSESFGIKSQPVDIRSVNTTKTKAIEPIHFEPEGLGERNLNLLLPAGISGQLMPDAGQKIELKPQDPGMHEYFFPGGEEIVLKQGYIRQNEKI